MKSITGKLAFAYSTIQKMEDRITELESANAELLDALKRIADPRNTHFSGDAQVVAREAIEKYEEK